MTEARTVSISIRKAPEEAYEFLSDPVRYPEWSEFITDIQQEAGEWLATTPNGRVRMTFTPRNSFFILDHFVTVSPEVTVYVPMRVVKNSEGSEVLFTVFRMPGMSDEQYETDLGMVIQDLANLKQVLEGK
jgi:hypothetical protein